MVKETIHFQSDSDYSLRHISLMKMIMECQQLHKRKKETVNEVVGRLRSQKVKHLLCVTYDTLKVKIVKYPLLFLHQCTFTMHKPRVLSISQW